MKVCIDEDYIRPMKGLADIAERVSQAQKELGDLAEKKRKFIASLK